MTIRAFTVKYTGISNKLLTNVNLKSFLSSNLHNCLALWDTGATSSCISENLARKMNLVPTGKKTIETAAGQSNQSTYCIDLFLPDNVVISGLPVVDCKINNQKIDMLIGMDVISKGDLSVSNLNNKTYFSFRIPSIKHADFVHEITLNKIIGPKHGIKH